MSLIVLSNKNYYESDRNTPVGGIESPFAFTNTLQTPVVIPEDAEVALQSLKIVKDGLFTITPSNNIMYQYIGAELVDGGLESADSTRFVSRMEVAPQGEYTPENFLTTALVPSMKRAIYHPDFQNQQNASVNRAAGDNTFEGFNLKYDRLGSASGTNGRPTSANDFIGATEASEGFTYDPSNHRFIKTSGNGSNASTKRAFGICKFAPLSCCEGNFMSLFTNASEWSIGLSRYCNPSFTYSIGSESASVDNTQPKHFRGGNFFYDYVAQTEDNLSTGVKELKLYHAVKAAGTEDQIEMREVIYYGYTGAKYAVPYDLDTNASKFNRITFTLTGEKVEAFLSVGGRDAGPLTKFCSPDLGTPGKENFFKPINQACAYLYPKYEIFDDGTLTEGKNHYITMNEFDSRSITGFNYDGLDTSKSLSLPLKERLINYDFYATAMAGGVEYRDIVDLDTRKFNDIDDATAHTFTLLSGGKVDYKIVPIPGKSQQYYYADEASMKQFLGFTENALRVESSISGSAVTFTSDVIPTLVANESLFVRLSSLTQRSINGVTGNESKIIYHCPRFDNAGNETGGLFFEPGEKTYLDVGNISKTPIGSFSIEIVDMNEKPIKSLVGRTVVVLHIREKGSHEGRCHPMKC